MSTSIPPGNRLPVVTYRGVQALRFLSALVVVAVHAVKWYNRDTGTAHPVPVHELIGDVCVAAFFLISGFVVVHVVDSGREPDWKTFAMRRAIRILPLAWTMTSVKIVASVLAPDAMNDGVLSPIRILASYLLIPSFDEAGAVRLLWGVEWTLVFEVAFYAVVAVALAIRIDPVSFMTPVLLAITIASAWRPENGAALWFYVDPVVGFLLVGAVIGRAVHAARPGVWVAGSLCSTGVLMTMQIVDGGWSALPTVTASAALVGGFALLVRFEGHCGRYIPNWLVLGGETAFALYLTHPLVAQALPRVLGDLGMPDVPWIPVVLTSTAASIALAWAVHRWVDDPVGRHLRRRLLHPFGRGLGMARSRTKAP